MLKQTWSWVAFLVALVNTVNFAHQYVSLGGMWELNWALPIKIFIVAACWGIWWKNVKPSVGVVVSGVEGHKVYIRR